MKSLITVGVVTLSLVGCSICDETLPSKIAACEGNSVRGCSPTIYFNANSAEISPKGRDRLAWGIEKANRWPEKKILVTGSADSEESHHDEDLAKKRALAVKDYYKARGIASDRIEIAVKGQEDLICDVPECRQVDRQVEVKFYNPKHWWIF